MTQRSDSASALLARNDNNLRERVSVACDVAALALGLLNPGDRELATATLLGVLRLVGTRSDAADNWLRSQYDALTSKQSEYSKLGASLDIDGVPNNYHAQADALQAVALVVEAARSVDLETLSECLACVPEAVVEAMGSVVAPLCDAMAASLTR